MTIIPSNIFQYYHTVVDELINNNFIGKVCTVFYPAVTSSCDNCTTAFFGGISKNVSKVGASLPFFNGQCPLCGGNGTKQLVTTDTLRLRVYWDKKDWIKQGNISIPNSDVMILGFSDDLPKILRMEEIQLVSEQNFITSKYSLSGEPFTHGFGHNRYFVAYLKRS